VEITMVLAQLATMLAEHRGRILEYQHDLDALIAENTYQREVIGRLTGGPPPLREEVHPYEGPFARPNEGAPVVETKNGIMYLPAYSGSVVKVPDDSQRG
jgi:hypothetical protein